MSGEVTPQGGLQRRWQLPGQRYNAMGQLVRGVVVATYVTDDPDHPETPEGNEDQRIPTGVYCDVLCYSSLPGLRYVALRQVMVLQDKGSMHDGRIWKPKAATFDITGDSLDVDGPTEVGNMDGDHVLIGFIEGNPTEPVILGGVPHPSRDQGNEENPTGRRLRLKLEDGDPDLCKHHGSFWGVENNGDWICDTTFANDGTLRDADGERGFEQPQPDDGKGAQRSRLPPAAEHLTEWVDHVTDPENPAVMSSNKHTTELRERKIQSTGTVIDELLDYADPNAPESKAHAKLTATLRELILKEAGSIWRVILEEGANTLEAKLADADAELKVGDGAVGAMIAQNWETFFDGDLKTWLTTHTHPTGVGPSGPPAEAAAFPAYASGGSTSTKLTFPDG